MKTNELNIWSGPEDVVLPVANASSHPVQSIIKCANESLVSAKQQRQIVSAFEIQAYDMGAEYAWRFTMATLKEKISSLGMKFVGEMLNREDIDEYASPEVVLTDYDAISLADQLGIVSKVGGIKLRHAQEMLNHFFSKECEETLTFIDALSIIESSVKYVLGQKDVAVSLEFNKFRNRLQSESISNNDGQLQMLVNSALFYIRTVVNVLLSNAKTSKSAALEHSLANFNTILPLVWEKLAEKDKWNVGMAYRDVVTDGNDKSAMGMKKALMKVRGFDFVPESLRSNTFKKAARAVIDTHFAYNNYYNEPAVVKSLSKLGSTIPSPALQECMDSYLLVYLGNTYGVSREAAPIAKNELLSISNDRWEYFFNSIISKDEIVLLYITTPNQLDRFANLLNEIGEEAFHNLNGDGKQIYNAIIKRNHKLYSKIRDGYLKQL